MPTSGADFHLVELIEEFVVLFLQRFVLTPQAVVLDVGILNAVAEDGITSDEHQDDDGHKACDDDDCNCINIIYMY